MNDLLANPAIQSGIIPFLVGMLAAWGLRRLGWFWSGLGFAIAYYVSVYFAAGFQLTPLTSTRKILILGIIAIILGFAVDSLKQKPVFLPAIMFIIGAAAMSWVIWPVAARQEGGDFWIMLLPSLAYAGWLTASSELLRAKPDEGAMVALTLGLGTGISAMLGASALLGQLGIAIGAIAGGYLILLLLKQNIQLGSNFMLPVGLLSGLLGIAAVVYASLPWYSLLPLLVIPAMTYLPVASGSSKFKQLLMLALYTVPFTILSIIITWMSTGSSESGY
ncbi:hypothetical protein [Kaarinaea lacus]